MKWWQVILSQFVEKIPRIIKIILGKDKKEE